jgi:hypothetical protein
VEIRIGVTHTPKEIEVDLPPEADRDKVIAEIDAAMNGTGTMLWLTDRKGRRVGVPTDRVAYIEIGSDAEAGRRVGFSAL